MLFSAWETVNGNERLDSCFLGQCNVLRKLRPAMMQQRVMAT